MPIREGEHGHFILSPRFRYTATFELEHPNLSRTQVSAALRMSPDPALPVAAGGRGRGVWICGLPGEDALAAELGRFSERLEGAKAFLERVRGAGGGYRFLVVCFVDWNAALMLDFVLLRRLARLRIDLTLQAVAADSAATTAALGKLRAQGLPF